MARNYRSVFRKDIGAKERSPHNGEQFNHGKELVTEHTKQKLARGLTESNVNLSPVIAQQIADAIRRREKKRENREIQLFQEAIAYLEGEITSELKNFNLPTFQNTPEERYRILLASSFLQQKMASCIQRYFLKHSHVERLPEFLNHFKSIVQREVPPTFSAQTHISLSNAVKWFFSHALVLDLFDKKQWLSILQLESTHVKAFDLNNGVDIVVTDRVVHRSGKKYIIVYLIDAKSFIGEYGEHVVPHYEQWKNYKKHNTPLFQKLDQLVKSNKKDETLEVVPVKMVIHTAFDHHFDKNLQDVNALKEQVAIIEKNLDTVFSSRRAYLMSNVEDREELCHADVKG